MKKGGQNKIHTWIEKSWQKLMKNRIINMLYCGVVINQRREITKRCWKRERHTPMACGINIEYTAGAYIFGCFFVFNIFASHFSIPSTIIGSGALLFQSYNWNSKSNWYRFEHIHYIPRVLGNCFQNNCLSYKKDRVFLNVAMDKS